MKNLALPQGGKFPSAKKFISLRKKIFFLAEGNLFSSARKFCSLRRAIFSLAEGARFPSKPSLPDQAIEPAEKALALVARYT